MTKHTNFGVEERFFDRPSGASKVKQHLVVEYFGGYSNVLARDTDVGYVDLFAGPGLYDSGEKSVPVLITELVLRDERLRRHVRLWFNEADPNFYSRLRDNIFAIPGIEALKHAPQLTNRIVGTQLGPRTYTLPTFVFADPCGYKGLSLELINAALKGAGTDCLFFFNYRRVNMKLSFPVMDASINEFFSKQRADELRRKISSLKPRAREAEVLAAIGDEIKRGGGIPLGFRFKSAEGGGTSHHLVFASKHPKGATIMKRIFTKYSSEVIEGVGSFEFDPRASSVPTLPLFSPIKDIADELLETFAGETLTFEDLVNRQAGSPYTDTTLREAVLDLESEFRIEVSPPARKRRMMAGGTRRSLPPTTVLKLQPSWVIYGN